MDISTEPSSLPLEIWQRILLARQFSAKDLSCLRLVSRLHAVAVDHFVWRLQGLEIPWSGTLSPAAHFGDFWRRAVLITTGVDSTQRDARFGLGNSTVLQKVLPQFASRCAIWNCDGSSVFTIVLEEKLEGSQWAFRDCFTNDSIIFELPQSSKQRWRAVKGIAEGRAYALLVRQGARLVWLRSFEKPFELQTQGGDVSYVSVGVTTALRCIVVGRQAQVPRLELSDYHTGKVLCSLERSVTRKEGKSWQNPCVSLHSMPNGWLCVTFLSGESKPVLEYWYLNAESMEVYGKGIIAGILGDPIEWAAEGLVAFTQARNRHGRRRSGRICLWALRGSDPVLLGTYKIPRDHHPSSSVDYVAFGEAVVHRGSLYLCAGNYCQLALLVFNRPAGEKRPGCERWWTSTSSLRIPLCTSICIQWLPGDQLYLAIGGSTASTEKAWVRQFHVTGSPVGRPTYRRVNLGMSDVDELLPVSRYGASHLFAGGERSYIFSYKSTYRFFNAASLSDSPPRKRRRLTRQKNDPVAQSNGL